MPQKKLQAPTDATEPDNRPWPRPEYNRRPLRPVAEGTTFWHLGENPRIFIADAQGRMHEVLEWELALAELSGRRITNPQRRSHLFDPGRVKARPHE